jgi:hypothetical protein
MVKALQAGGVGVDNATNYAETQVFIAIHVYFAPISDRCVDRCQGQSVSETPMFGASLVR